MNNDIEQYDPEVDLPPGHPDGYKSTSNTLTFCADKLADPEELKVAIKRFCAVKPSERVAAACLKYGVEPFEVLAAAAEDMALDPEIRLRAAEGLAKRLDPLEGAQNTGSGALNVFINIDKAQISAIRAEMQGEESTTEETE